MLERDHFITCERFVEFLDRYTSCISQQLIGVEKSVEAAITEIMGSINAISKQTEGYKKQADMVLEQTYLSPSQETQELVAAVQSGVDDLIDGLQREASGQSVGEESESAASVRRLAGHFSKRMESMSTVDDAMGALLTTMAAALSSGDVIFQRIEHVSRSLNALNLGLAYVLVDINGRFTLAGINKLKADLLEYTYRQYGSEEERQLHNSVMGNRAA